MRTVQDLKARYIVKCIWNIIIEQNTQRVQNTEILHYKYKISECKK